MSHGYTPRQIAEVGRILAAARAEARKQRRPATPPPPFPRRIIVADYCRECGRTSDCWQGCAGGERVAAISHTRSGAAARLENERGSLDGPGQYVGASLSEHRKGAPNEKA